MTAEALRAKLLGRSPWQAPRTASTKLASVAAILRGTDELEVLLIKRAAHPIDPWAGHMAFPGGRKDQADADLVATAIRETREEVGIDLAADAELLGRLDDVQAIARARPVDLIIAPHVFSLARDVTLDIDRDEVELALWAPIGPMLRGETTTSRPYVRDGVVLELPGRRVGDHVVWGLTYRMLELLFDVLRG
jgi:8-oxo-dGTP pyrophosphatase MutT (NUDIX family)